MDGGSRRLMRDRVPAQSSTTPTTLAHNGRCLHS